MLFNELLNGKTTEEKTVIKYKADGNGVKTVKKQLISLEILYNDKSLFGLYADATEPENGIIIYKDYTPCMEIETLYNEYSAENIHQLLQNFNKKYNTYEDYKNDIADMIKSKRFIKNDVLMLLSLHGDMELLKEAKIVKDNIIKQREAEETARIEKRQKEKAEKDATEKAERERKKQEKIDFLCGYAEGKTSIQVERLYNVLSKVQGYADNGKTIYKSRKQFIVDALTEGGRIERKENVVTYYGSKWDVKQSKPKTVYRLYVADGGYYTLTKTEFDFACFIMEKSA